MRPIKTLVLAFGVVLAACGSTEAVVDSGQEVPPPAAEDETLDDSGSIDDGQGTAGIDIDALTNGSWTLRFGGGPEGEIVLVDGLPITITFNGDGSFGGTAACNGYGGTYQIDGNEIFFGEFGSDDSGCEPEVAQSSQALSGRSSVAIAPVGSLLIRGRSTRMR